MKKLNLDRTVFNKDAWNNTIVNSFTELKATPDQTFFDRDLAELPDFWYLYEKFFYQIPKLGNIESHEYLAKTSGEFADSEYVSAQIQTLLDEIELLRSENLKLLEENINLQIPADKGPTTDKFGDQVSLLSDAPKS